MSSEAEILSRVKVCQGLKAKMDGAQTYINKLNDQLKEADTQFKKCAEEWTRAIHELDGYLHKINVK